MFLKMSLRARANAAIVAEYLDEFLNICDDMREHVKIELYPFGKCLSEYFLQVSYKEKKGAHMTGRDSGYLKMEIHR